MKKIILLATALTGVLLSSNSYGQCAVYFDKKTGVYAVGYHAVGDPFYILSDVEAIASKGCQDNGGENCTLVYHQDRNDAKGWWALLQEDKYVGEGAIGKITIACCKESESEAESEAKKEFEKMGGVKEGATIRTWYVK